MKLNNKLAPLRLNNGYSKYYVAQKLNLSPSTVTNIENGVYAPRLDTLIKMASLYGLSADELLKEAV